jgi:hypothetical protein
MTARDLPYCSFVDGPRNVRCLLSQHHDGEHALITDEMWHKLMEHTA